MTFRAILIHEIARNLKSPRWWLFATVIICLMLFSALNFLSYQSERQRVQSEAGERLRRTLQTSSETAELQVAEIELTKGPRPAEIFAFGLERLAPDTVRFNLVDGEILTSHAVESNLLLSSPRQLDWSFVVLYCLSLGALLLGHDSVSNELEQGTLRLLLANPVSRAVLLLGKTGGLWLAAGAPLLLGAVAGLCGLAVGGIRLRIIDLASIGMALALSLLFLAAVLLAAIWTSIASRSSSTSLILVSTGWIAMVFVLPGLSRATAEFAAPVESVSLAQEIAKLRVGFVDSNITPDYRMLRSQAQSALRSRTRSLVERQLSIASAIDSVSLASPYRDSITAITDCCLPRHRAFLSEAEAYLTRLQSSLDTASSKPGNAPQLPVFRERERSIGQRVALCLRTGLLLPLAVLCLFVGAFFSFARMEVAG